MKNVTVLAYDNCWAMNVMMVNDLFAIVERLQHHHQQTLSFCCQIISHHGDAVRTASRSIINVDAALDDVKT